MERSEIQDVLVEVKFKVPIRWSLFFSLFGSRVRKKKKKKPRGKNSKCLGWSQSLCKVMPRHSSNKGSPEVQPREPLFH
jgi:hypothetical protein